MTMRIDRAALAQQIASLAVQFPELADDEEAFALSVESETELPEYLSMILRAIGESRSMAAGTAEYIKELQDRKARFERREEALRILAFKIMSDGHMQKCERPEGTLSIRNGTPKVIVTNESVIPERYMRVKYEPDRIAIKDALARGDNVPGATLSNSEPALSIRTK